jgi:hypothetical protein
MLMSFLDDVKAFQVKALTDVNNSVCNVVNKLCSSIIELSPTPPGTANYAKGLLKNQWYPSIGMSPSIMLSSSDEPTGSESFDRLNKTIAEKPFYSKDNMFMFTNNVPYAYRVEMLGWPKDDPSNTSGWEWTGNATAYHMVERSITKIKGDYQ